MIYISYCFNRIKSIYWLSRKAWLLTTTLVILFLFFSSLFKKKEERIKGEWIAKIVMKSHAFLLNLYFNRKDNCVDYWLILTIIVLSSLKTANYSYDKWYSIKKKVKKSFGFLEKRILFSSEKDGSFWIF